MPPELAVYQYAASVSGPEAPGQWVDREPASKLMLEPGGLNSPLEAVFYELGLDPGCSL